MDGRLKRLLLTGFLFLMAVVAARFYVVGRAYSATALHALERRGDITEHERTTIAVFDRHLAKKYPTPPATAGIVFDDDWGRLSEEAFLRDFAGDLSHEEARVLYAVQQPFKKSLTTEKTTNTAWRTKPSFYAVSTQDRTINPDLERFMAKRMGAKTIEIEASHLALISHPDVITNLILEALAAAA